MYYLQRSFSIVELYERQAYVGIGHMIIIIDGYNVLRHLLHPEFVSDHHKNTFIRQLNKYSKNKGHKIVLIFDGGPYEWPDKERVDGIYVIHSGYKESADDYIKQYLDEHKAQDILLVSTDRDLGAHASRLGIESIDSLDFYSILQGEKRNIQKMGKEKKVVKLTKKDRPELDELMLEASKNVPGKTEDVIPNKHKRKSLARKLSKKERKMEKKLKKL